MEVRFINSRQLVSEWISDDNELAQNQEAVRDYARIVDRVVGLESFYDDDDVQPFDIDWSLVETMFLGGRRARRYASHEINDTSHTSAAPAA